VSSDGGGLGSGEIRGWAFIIGSMKSGTTTLFEHLSRHPAVCPSRIKEPNFFSDDDRWKRGLDWYRELFDWDPAAHRWALEASTAYTKHPEVSNPAERIAALPGRKRLIYLMRDPVERIASQIGYGKAKKWTTFTGMGGRVPSKAIDVSRYARQLAPYRRELGSERLKLLLFEDLVASPGSVVEEVCAFLGLDADGCPEEPEKAFNVTSELVVPPDWYERVRDVAVVRWVRSLPVSRTWLGSILPGFETAERYELSPGQRRYVLSELRDDLVTLREEFGVDVSRWGHDV
jgi:hypothetical protein